MVATALALAYPAAVATGPWALAGVTVAAAVSGCALALARRPSARLRAAIAAIAAWLAIGLAGAFLLRAHAGGGFAWVLFVLFVIPLPPIPWLYARTFASSGGAHGQDAPGPPAPARPQGRGDGR